jgi:hypothetical protein
MEDAVMDDEDLRKTLGGPAQKGRGKPAEDMRRRDARDTSDEE